MTHIEVKACQLREEAKRRVKSAGFLKSLFLKSANKSEESIEFYKRAGNLFKMSKNWSQAGTAFHDAANLCSKSKDFTEAALNFVEAATCFKHYDNSKAIEAYQEAIKLYIKDGKFYAAAQHYQAIGEIFKDELEYDNAVLHFEQAVTLFRRESRYVAANKCLEKIGEFAAMTSDYIKAIKIFEEIAYFDLASSILKYQAKNYFFRAAICLLCTGAKITTKLLTYINIYPAFEESKECKLVKYLSECLKNNDLEKYEIAIREFDSESELSQWHIILLLRTKNLIESDLFIRS